MADFNTSIATDEELTAARVWWRMLTKEQKGKFNWSEAEKGWRAYPQYVTPGTPFTVTSDRIELDRIVWMYRHYEYALE